MAISEGLNKISVLNDDTKSNGVEANGHKEVNGNGINKTWQATKHASGPEGVDGLQNGATDVISGLVSNGSVNSKANGVTNGVNGYSNGNGHCNGYSNGVH